MDSINGVLGEKEITILNLLIELICQSISRGTKYFRTVDEKGDFSNPSTGALTKMRAYDGCASNIHEQHLLPPYEVSKSSFKSTLCTILVYCDGRHHINFGDCIFPFAVVD